MSANPVQDQISDLPVLRLAAFPAPDGGGNPAGVVVEASPGQLNDNNMQATAAELRFSETAFVTNGPILTTRREYDVRYFSPEAEVPFCGHATIALSVAICERIGVGDLVLNTAAGAISVRTDLDTTGQVTASLTSVSPTHAKVDSTVLTQALECFGWTTADLDERVAPAIAFAGATHLVLPLRSRSLLSAMAYDYDRLRNLCRTHGWVTVHVGFMESAEIHHVRAPFPFGGVVEDPATGAGAAAYGAYLRDVGVLTAPFALAIRQGDDMGQPCRLAVKVPAEGPAEVSGTADPMT